MGEAQLFISCRIGDLHTVRHLVENCTVELNVRDHWDSTPLYYACLCGHEELVEYLLKNGARCEPNTFDGERCLYAALTDRIRRVLRSYKAITPECMRRDSYREFLRRCLEEPHFADICFLVHGRAVHLHRCILSARSTYFAEMFTSRWLNKFLIELNHPLVKPRAFQAIAQFLYTDRMDVNMDDIEDCIRLARQCQLTSLKQRLETTRHNVEMFGRSKPGTQHITVVSVEPESNIASMPSLASVNDAFGQLAELVMPPPFRLQQFPGHFFEDASSDLYEFFQPFVTCLPHDPAEEPWDEAPPYADVCFLVEGVRFYAHQVFFCGRSDYFKALLSGRFQEGLSPGAEMTGCGQNPILEVSLRDVSAEVFAVVVAFIYKDHARVSDELLVEVLWAAELLLLPGLKRLCAVRIGNALDPDSVLPVLKMSRMLNLSRLEEDCCAFMAGNLETMIDRSEFHAMIQGDAAAVGDRQELDSIPLVDDIRSHLYSGLLPTGTGQDDCEKKLDLINELLVQLGLEC